MLVFVRAARLPMFALYPSITRPSPIHSPINSSHSHYSRLHEQTNGDESIATAVGHLHFITIFRSPSFWNVFKGPLPVLPRSLHCITRLFSFSFFLPYGADLTPSLELIPSCARFPIFALPCFLCLVLSRLHWCRFFFVCLSVLLAGVLHV